MRLPSLNALYVFTITAQELNMSRAAERLFVTQGAVSRQIQGLEDELGVLLFSREARGLSLTAAGRALLPTVQESFSQIERAVRKLKQPSRDVRLKLPPTLAMRWFLPRLADFQARHPDIEVRMSTSSCESVQFEREDFDAAIIYSRQALTDVHSSRLFAERLTPVCAPAVAAQLHCPADLAQQPLIHLTPDCADWRAWLVLAGVEHPTLSQGPSFEVIDMAVNLAGQGQGVALGDPLLLIDDLLLGRLVTPFPQIYHEYGYSYWMTCPSLRRDEAGLCALADWLQLQAERTQAQWLDWSGGLGRE